MGLYIEQKSAKLATVTFAACYLLKGTVARDCFKSIRSLLRR
jgi:hypothetical protein